MSATITPPAEAQAESNSSKALKAEILDALREVDGNELRIGELLKKVKDSEPHGGFGKWLKKAELPTSRRAVSNYMSLADFVAWRQQKAPEEERWPNYIAYALGPHIKSHPADVHDILNAMKHRNDCSQETLRALIHRKIKKQEPQKQEIKPKFVTLLTLLKSDSLRNTSIESSGIQFFDQLSKNLSHKSAKVLLPCAEAFISAVIDLAQTRKNNEQPTRQDLVPVWELTEADSIGGLKTTGQEVPCGVSG